MTSWKLFSTAKSALDAMYEDCSRAKKSIDVEQHILIDDTSGKRFLDLFAKKVKQNVRVRVICDMVGSYSLYESVRARELREFGVEIYFFNPISVWRLHTFTKLFFRTHQKLLIIDDSIAHVGGVGIREDLEQRLDLNVRLIGPVVETIKIVFEKIFIATRNGRPACYKLRGQIGEDFILLTDAPYPRRRYFYRSFLKTVGEANKSINIITPYFVPNVVLLRRMSKAIRRGVELRLIVPQKTDHATVDAATMASIGFVLRAGGRVFRHDAKSYGFIHSKMAVIDDAWAYVGSTNLDSQSLKFNHESNIVSTNKKFINEVAIIFSKELDSCKEYTLSDWKRRSLVSKILEILTWPIRGLL